MFPATRRAGLLLRDSGAHRVLRLCLLLVLSLLAMRSVACNPTLTIQTSIITAVTLGVSGKIPTRPRKTLADMLSKWIYEKQVFPVGLSPAGRVHYPAIASIRN